MNTGACNNIFHHLKEESDFTLLGLTSGLTRNNNLHGAVIRERSSYKLVDVSLLFLGQEGEDVVVVFTVGKRLA